MPWRCQSVPNELFLGRGVFFEFSQKILRELESDPKVAQQRGLTPERLPGLVEHNPQIAIEVLLRLMDSAQISE